jgi:hypothetical protein
MAVSLLLGLVYLISESGLRKNLIRNPGIDTRLKKTPNAQRPTRLRPGRAPPWRASNAQLRGQRRKWILRRIAWYSILFDMSATEVIKELEELPSQEREKVLCWLQQQGLKDLWARADALMKDAPKLNEDEILRLPRVRPSGF